jgi:transposase
MLYEAQGIKRFVVVCGYTDLRKGIGGLAQILEGNYRLDPFEMNTLFLFCGKRGDRIKALLWEGNGFLLLYKRWERGSLSWPRTPNEVADISKHDFRLLLQGLNPVHPKVQDVKPASSF